MTKKSFWDNSSLQQDIKWDNQELPGVPDEVLLTKNWNQVEGLRSFWNSEKGQQHREYYSEMSRKANNQRLSNPEYRKKIEESSRRVAKDPERNKRLSESSKKRWNSKEGKQQRSQQQKENWKNHKDIMQNALKQRYADGTLAKKISESLKKSDKLKQMAANNTNEMQTPDGVFPSRKAAAEFYGIQPTSMNKRMQSYPDQYYYIKVNNASTGYKNKKK